MTRMQTNWNTKASRCKRIADIQANQAHLLAAENPWVYRQIEDERDLEERQQWNDEIKNLRAASRLFARKASLYRQRAIRAPRLPK